MEYLSDLSKKYLSERAAKLDDFTFDKTVKIINIIKSKFNSQPHKRLIGEIEISRQAFEIEKIEDELINDVIKLINRAISIYNTTLNVVLDKKQQVWQVKIQNPRILDQIIDELNLENNKRKTTHEKIAGRMIFKNENGDFCMGRFPIKLKSRDTVNYKVFDVLIELSGSEQPIPYSKIEKGLIKRGEDPKIDKLKINSRINNAIGDKNGFFRYAKYNNQPFQNKIPGSDNKFFEVVRGKGIKVNNPKV